MPLMFFALLLASVAPAPLHLTRPVQDKNFYALSLLARQPAVLRNSTLDTLRDAKLLALHHAVSTCALDTACFAQAMRFSGDEIDLIATTLKNLHLDDE